MKRLKYKDLLALIIEINIRKIENLKNIKKEKSDEIEVTPEMAARILKG